FWLYERLPRARLRAEGAIAFTSPLSEVDIGFIGDAVAMAAALIGLGRHVRHLSRNGAVPLCHAANRRRCRRQHCGGGDCEATGKLAGLPANARLRISSTRAEYLPTPWASNTSESPAQRPMAPLTLNYHRVEGRKEPAAKFSEDLRNHQKIQPA